MSDPTCWVRLKKGRIWHVLKVFCADATHTRCGRIYSLHQTVEAVQSTPETRICEVCQLSLKKHEETAAAGIRSIVTTHAHRMGGTLYDHDFKSFVTEQGLRKQKGSANEPARNIAGSET